MIVIIGDTDYNFILQPYFGKSPRTPKSAPVQLGGSSDINTQLQAEREANRRLQQHLIQTETELMDLKMDLKLTRVNHFGGDDNSSQATSPSAPPPPYLHGHNGHHDDRASQSPSVNSAASTASSSDNNLPTMNENDYLDVDHAVNGRRQSWHVHADVHHRASEVEDDEDCRSGELTFTESALNLIQGSHTSPMKRMNN